MFTFTDVFFCNFGYNLCSKIVVLLSALICEQVYNISNDRKCLFFFCLCVCLSVCLYALCVCVICIYFNKHSLNDLYIAQITHARSNYHQKQFFFFYH